MRVVYIDTLFFVNFVINYLLLVLTARICAVIVRRLRLAAAAALGAAYAVCAVLPGLEFLSHAAVKISAAAVVVTAAFACEKGMLRAGLVFAAVSAAFGGAMYAVVIAAGGQYAPVSPKALIISFGVTYSVIALVFGGIARRRGKGGTVRAVIEFGGRKTALTALRDTGNCLTDPISGAPVMVTGPEAAAEIFPLGIRVRLTPEALKNPVRTLETLAEAGKGERFRLLPYTAVGTDSGMLLACRPDRVTLDGNDASGMIIAFSPTRVSAGIYNALIGAD